MMQHQQATLYDEFGLPLFAYKRWTQPEDVSLEELQ
jgi:hypothetical protein